MAGSAQRVAKRGRFLTPEETAAAQVCLRKRTTSDRLSLIVCAERRSRTGMV
jgi:hypothetical protein